MSQTNEAFLTNVGETINMEENSKEYYISKTKELETEILYLTTILESIVSICNVSDYTIKKLANAALDAHKAKRKKY